MFLSIDPPTIDLHAAILRLGVHLAFIGLMIYLTSRHIGLRRYSFTFLMISLVVYFLCYTLKNFDLNLGMALGLFAIFGIIRYRTAPLETEEMTYLFITIGMAVINALSNDFLTLFELGLINVFVLLFIVFGELVLIRFAYRDHVHPLDQSLNRRIVLLLPVKKEGKIDLEDEILKQEKKLNIQIKNHRIIKIDESLNQVVVHLFY